MVKAIGPYLLSVIILITVGFTCAEPVKDGDLFWHMEYGRYMLQQRTLIPDHTLYSWTPSTNAIIYCAWLGEMALYVLYTLGGLPLLFVFKYACMVLSLLLVWYLSAKLEMGKRVFTFFVLLMVLLASHGATYVKPEIMSMVFLAFVGGIYYAGKTSLWERWGTKVFLLYPLVFLLWVNTHGVFVFGMVLLAFITFGELLNFFFRHQTALTRRGLGHLVTGSVLSVIATLINPYGVAYHLSLYHSYVVPSDKLRITTVAAWVSPFDPRAASLHYVEFFLIMGGTLIALYGLLVWKKKTWDWSLFLSNLVMAWVSMRYLRTFFYWPAFWGMSVIFLFYAVNPQLPKIPKIRLVVNGLLIVLFLLLAYRGNFEAKYRRGSSTWCGFGIGYLNPVEASAFLKKYHPGKRLYNSYDIGGYLIHDLFPDYKIFCDPRAFPYADWYGEYWDFNNGPTPLEEFGKKFDFDVAVVDYRSSESPILKFLQSRDWEPVFFGPAAMVFVRKDVDFPRDIRKLDPSRFDGLKSLAQTVMVFRVAASLGDLDASEYILNLMKKKFSPLYAGYRAFIEVSTLAQEGLRAYAAGDYETSWEKLSKLNADQEIVRVNLVLLQLRNWKCKQLVMTGKYREGMGLIEDTLRQQPNYVDGLYNAGILGYQVEQSENEGSSSKPTGEYPILNALEMSKKPRWREHLERFLVLDPNHRYAEIVRRVLKGEPLQGTIPLIL